MVYDKGMLEKDKKDMEQKRYELENALEEVYALRLDLEKGKRIGKKKMNTRLEEIKENILLKNNAPPNNVRVV